MISVEELPNFPASIDEIVEIKEAENHKFHDVLKQARAMAGAIVELYSDALEHNSTEIPRLVDIYATLNRVPLARNCKGAPKRTGDHR